jgi:hypothetical protein
MSASTGWDRWSWIHEEAGLWAEDGISCLPNMKSEWHLKFYDDGTLEQILRFWTLSIVLFSSKTPSSLYLKTRRFGDWIRSLFSVKTYSLGPNKSWVLISVHRHIQKSSTTVTNLQLHNKWVLFTTDLEKFGLPIFNSCPGWAYKFSCFNYRSQNTETFGTLEILSFAKRGNSRCIVE